MNPRVRGGLMALFCLLLAAGPALLNAQSVPVDIELESGGNRLQARFFPAAAQSPTVVLLPDLPGVDIADSAALGMGTALSRAGIHVLAFNYRGTHRSQGEFTLSGVAQDLNAARRWLTSQETVDRFGVDPDNLAIGGYGFGGGMALAYAATDLTITSAFSIAGFDPSVAMTRYAADPLYASSLEARLDEPSAEDPAVRWERGDFFAFVKEAMQSSGRWDLRFLSPQLSRKRLMLVGGLDDVVVPLEEHVLPLYRTLRGLGTGELALEVYQDDHAFAAVRDELTETLIEWILEGLRP